MALHDVVLAPELTKVYFRMLCREVGLSHIAYSSGKLCFSDLPNGKVFVPALLTLEEFNKVRPRLERSAYQIVVFLHETATSVPLRVVKIENITDLSEAMTRSVKGKSKALPAKLSRETGDFVQVATNSMGNSVLHKTQTALYRVPKEDRSFVQTAVYTYLAGAIDTIGRAAEYGYLLALVHTPELQKLRQAALMARKTSIDEAVASMNVDKFDLNYLLHKLA